MNTPGPANPLHGRAKRRAAMLAAGALLLAGCGEVSAGGTQTGANGASGEVAQALEAFMEPVPFDPTVDAKGGDAGATPIKPPPDKDITVIVCTASAEGCASVGERVKEAGDDLGWHVDVVDGQGRGDVMDTAMRTAVAQRVDGIVLVAIDSEAVPQGLAAAHEAGIPVVTTASNNVEGDGPDKVFDEVSFDSESLGEMAATWIVADSGGEARVLIFDAPESAALRDRLEGTKSVLDECEGCEIADEVKFTLAAAATDLPLRTKSALQADPTINYIWSPSGGFGTMQAQSVREMGNSTVKIVGFDCDSSSFDEISSGDSPYVACAGLALAQAGYTIVDSLARAFLDLPPSDTEGAIRLFDASNLPDGQEGWEGDGDYRAAYLELWGVS